MDSIWAKTTMPSFPRLNGDTDTDILIIGGGAAGCYAALTLQKNAPEARVLILEKAEIRRSGERPPLPRRHAEYHGQNYGAAWPALP